MGASIRDRQQGSRYLFAVLYGGQISISVALAAAIISALIGFGVGLVSGYCGGKVDTVLMAAVDFILSFPSLLLAVAISVILPPGIYTVMIAIACVGWTSFARIVRGQVLSYKEMPFGRPHGHTDAATGGSRCSILLRSAYRSVLS